jgi:hypothetical protein
MWPLILISNMSTFRIWHSSYDWVTIGQYEKSKRSNIKFIVFTSNFDQVVLYIQHGKFESYIMDLRGQVRGQGQGQNAIWNNMVMWPLIFIGGMSTFTIWYDSYAQMTIGQYERSKKVKYKVSFFTLNYDEVV